MTLASCPKCRKGVMIPNEAFPDDERNCSLCGYLQIRCSICRQWRANQAYGQCDKCYRKLNKRTAEDLE